MVKNLFGGGKKPVQKKPEAPAASTHPHMVSLHYPDVKTLGKAYMPFLKGGGVFLPVAHDYDIGEEVFLLITLPTESKPRSVQGKVVWRTPGNALGGWRQGVGIQFQSRDGGGLRERIEKLLGPMLNEAGATYTM